MEETTLSLHTWFWLIVPMLTVFVLSIVNYLRKRDQEPSADPKNGGRS